MWLYVLSPDYYIRKHVVEILLFHLLFVCIHSIVLNMWTVSYNPDGTVNCFQGFTVKSNLATNTPPSMILDGSFGINSWEWTQSQRRCFVAELHLGSSTLNKVRRAQVRTTLCLTNSELHSQRAGVWRFLCPGAAWLARPWCWPQLLRWPLLLPVVMNSKLHPCFYPRQCEVVKKTSFVFLTCIFLTGESESQCEMHIYHLVQYFHQMLIFVYSFKKFYWTINLIPIHIYQLCCKHFLQFALCFQFSVFYLFIYLCQK